MKIKNLVNTLSIAILLVTVNACSTVPLTGRSQANLVSESEMEQAATVHINNF
jgi:hypothetical protein